MYLFKSVIIIFFVGILSTGCINTKKSVYFNDVQNQNLIDTIINFQNIIIQNKDILQVTISTIDKDISMLFNPNTTINGTQSFLHLQLQWAWDMASLEDMAHVSCILNFSTQVPQR